MELISNGSSWSCSKANAAAALRPSAVAVWGQHGSVPTTATYQLLVFLHCWLQQSQVLEASSSRLQQLPLEAAWACSAQCTWLNTAMKLDNTGCCTAQHISTRVLHHRHCSLEQYAAAYAALCLPCPGSRPHPSATCMAALLASHASYPLCLSR